MDYKNYIASKLSIEGVETDTLASFLEVPPNTEMGDYALPCFKLAKVLRKSPIQIATDLEKAFVPDDVISSCTALNGYLNFKVNRLGFISATLSEIMNKGEKYGSNDIGKGKTVCIDYSSINIAKPFHIGH